MIVGPSTTSQPDEDQTAFDRVRSVAVSLEQPQSAQQISEQADVAEHTARKHLKRLVELNVMLAKDVGRTTLYAPDLLHKQLDMVRGLIDEVPEDKLSVLRNEKKFRIHEMQEEYSVETVQELHEKVGEVEDTKTRREMKKKVSEWSLLSVQIQAIEIAQELHKGYEKSYYDWSLEAE